MNEIKDQLNGHASTGYVLISISTIVFIAGVALVFTPEAPLGALAAIIALILGRKAFRHFEASVEPPPRPSPVAIESFKPMPVEFDFDEIQAFDASLKSGTELIIRLGIQYKTYEEPSKFLTKINLQIQHDLSAFLTTKEQVPEDWFIVIDSLLARTLQPLEKRLPIWDLLVQTIDVRVTRAAKSNDSKSIYISGDR